DEVNALVVEAVPARAARPLAVAVQVTLAVIGEDVVFTWDIEDPIRADTLQDLGDRIELSRLGQVRQVAGVEHEGRRPGHRVDLFHRLFESARHVDVRGLAETDVAVADLDEAEIALGSVLLVLPEGPRRQEPTPDAPEHAGPGPGHALQEATAVDAVARPARAGTLVTVLSHAISFAEVT